MRGIANYMTRQPWAVRVDDSTAVARRMLAEREVHHLPVLDGEQLVGMVTERDLAVAADRIGVPVEAVMTTVHLVDVETPLDAVLEMMSEHRWDAVVATSDGRIEGIFTAMDAVRVLRDLLRRRAA